MPMNRRRFVVSAAATSLSAPWVRDATAQQAASYPSKPIRVIVPFPPGVPGDVIARVVGQRLSASFGQPVIVENRPGAGANIGTEYVARAPADGYTLLLAGTNLAANPSLFRKVGYDPLKDFAPISSLIRTPSVLIVSLDSPLRTVADLVARARAAPGALSYASGGNGTLAHFSGELFKAGAGIFAVHIPYRGAPDILNSVLAKQTDFGFPILAGALAQIKGGKLRALAITKQRRIPQLPDVPTLSEAMPAGGFEIEADNGLVAPAGTPADIVAKLHAEIAKIVREPSVAAPMVAAGFEMVGNSPSEYAAHLAAEVVRYAALVKRTGAQVD